MRQLNSKTHQIPRSYYKVLPVSNNTIECFPKNIAFENKHIIHFNRVNYLLKQYNTKQPLCIIYHYTCHMNGVKPKLEHVRNTNTTDAPIPTEGICLHA